jgi:amino acid transporter
MFTDAMNSFVGSWASDVMSVLVVTSAFAAVLSCQNIIARYGYSLGVDGALPSALGRVHRRHVSPHVSSMTLTGIFVVGVVIFSGSDPALTYGWLAGAGGFPLLMLMFLTSVSVLVFFRRSRGEISDSTVWHTVVAPILAVIALGTALFLAFKNFTLLTGGDKSTAVTLQIVIWAVLVAGIVLALVYRAKKPDVYARIGRQTIS